MAKKAHLVDPGPNSVATGISPAVFCLTGVDREAISKRLGGASPVETLRPFTPSALASVVKSGRKAVLVYCEAEQFLVAAMLAGRSPRQVLTEWSSETAQMLRARSKSRQQVILVRHGHVLQGTVEDLRLLQEVAALPLDSVAPVSPDVPEPDAFYSVFARQLLTVSPNARALGLELEASSLPWAVKEAAADIDAIYEQHQKMLARLEQQVVALADAESLQSLLRDQIGQLQDELIGRVAQAGREEGRFSREIEQLRAELQAGKAREKSGKDREMALEQHVSAMEAQRDEIYDSQSWKMTRPLRALKETITGSTSKKTV